MSETNGKDAQVSMRLPGELKLRVEDYARLTGRSKSFVAMEALTEYLDWRLPQMRDLEEALAAADRGEFSSDAELDAMFARYGVSPVAAAAPAPQPARAVARPKRKRP